MPLTVNYGKSVTVFGDQYPTTPTVTAALAVPFNLSLPAAKAGSLTTRGSNTAGTLTMDPGHGFLTAGRLDLYWSGGSRRGILIGTVATNSVPFTGGAGDNLPTAATAITAMVPSEEAVVVTGDDVAGIVLYGASGGTFTFTDDADAEVHAVVLTVATPAYTWLSVDGPTNPLAGDDVAKLYLSHGAAAAATVRGAVLYN
jgi:hypothetical protein